MKNYKNLMEDELIAQINLYSKKSKAEGLNDSEKQVQQELRKEYLRRIRQSLKSELDKIDIV
ncbi:DUF896 domain-containing protein [Criibacterium bergeronii]|nr:DUF896 domain-containing protein [Criibacterium bergeronii]